MATTRLRRFGPRLTISLTGDDYDGLQLLASKREVSVSWVVRRAVQEYLDRYVAEQRVRPQRAIPRRARHSN